MYIKIPFWSDSVDWFDVRSSKRSLLTLGRPRLEFGSSHEKFDVWPRPNSMNFGYAFSALDDNYLSLRGFHVS